MLGVRTHPTRKPCVAALLVALPLFMGLSVVGSSSAASDSAPGLIAFAGVHWNADLNPAGSRIYVVRENGTGLSRLTLPGAREDTAPEWSPDGTKLAFGRREGKGWRIYVMNANGSGLHAVTRTQPLADSPSWSPDGKQLVFVQLPSGLPKTGCYAQQLYVVSVATGRVRQLTSFAAFPGGASAPAWSPDGTRILFAGKKSSAEKTHTDVWAIGPAGSAAKRLVANASDPAWSPDGQAMAFVRGGDLYTGSAKGTDIRRVTRTRDSESRPSWSPDGAAIAVARDHSPKNWKQETLRVTVVRVDGKAMLAITPADPHFWADAPSWQPGLER